jgi:hypothetical protein
MRQPYNSRRDGKKQENRDQDNPDRTAAEPRIDHADQIPPSLAGMFSPAGMPTVPLVWQIAKRPFISAHPLGRRHTPQIAPE